MFVPLHDGLPVRFVRAPFVTRGLIALCVLAFVPIALGLLPMNSTWIYAGLGLIPSVLFGTEALPDGLPFVPAPLTLVTSLFLHATWLHLIGNMLFLWVFGDNVEDAMGHGRYLLFVLLCGVAGALVHVLVGPASGVPLVGASGAIAGVVAGYLVLHPRVKLWCLVAGRIPLRVDARWALGAWVVMQFAFALLLADEEVAWWAHVGGVLAGAALIVVLRRKDVALLDRDLPATPPPPPMPTLPARQG